MKKNQLFYNLLEGYRNKILLVMKYLSFFLLLFVFYSFTDSYSQNKKLKIDLKHASLIDMIKEIENQSEFVFIYNDEILPVLQSHVFSSLRQIDEAYLLFSYHPPQLEEEYPYIWLNIKK